MGNPFGPNWAVFMLPVFEQGPLFRQANVNAYPGTANVANLASYNTAWRVVRGQPMPNLLCPSDISQRTWVLLQSANDGQVPGDDY
jgi:hypothetical protein